MHFSTVHMHISICITFSFVYLSETRLTGNSTSLLLGTICEILHFAKHCPADDKIWWRVSRSSDVQPGLSPNTEKTDGILIEIEEQTVTHVCYS